MNNTHLPRFSEIKISDIENNLTQILDANRQLLEGLLASNTTYTWDNLLAPIEEMEDRLGRWWSPISHMKSVVSSQELREQYDACLPKISEYSTEIGQNEQLYKAVQSIADSEDFNHFDSAQQKIIENDLRDFRLSGIALNKNDKQTYKELKKQLSKITSQFSENVLDATDAWSHLVSTAEEISGLPEHAVIAAAEAAKKKGLAGYLFTLEFPSYFAVVTYADNRELRRLCSTAFSTRASDQGPNASKWDNSQLMADIVALRQQVAKLLGFNNYAELSIERKMAESLDEVLGFLNDLAKRSVKKAHEEFKELQNFARKEFGVEQLEPWDLSYYSEKLREHRYAISQEDLRPYFQEDKVLSGMFAVINKLYNVTIKERDDVDTWHPDVRFFDISDPSGELRGQFYLDLYARENKRSGAWMDECVVRRKSNGDQLQTPVAYLTCNFGGPSGDKPSLLSHEEVLTLFHETGHGLHHMLTKINYAGVSGINGVPWDAVELPSQFFENWCWDKQALNLIAEHYETGEALPEELFNKMIAAKNFQSAMQMARQLEFSLFDFRIHMEVFEANPKQVQKILNEVRAEVSVVPIADYNRFQNSFSHIFAGGYAAGYYSYKWAEVLSSDAFSLFEEKGIFDFDTGQSFLHNILEKGGSQEPMELFTAFRGRKPNIDALLRHSGL